MRATGFWLKIEIRRRWRRQLGLALLVAVVGTVTLTCAAGARRTVSAYDRFVRTQALPDVELQASTDHDTMQALAELPGAASGGGYVPFFAAPSGHGLVPGRDFIVFAAADRHYTRTIDRPLITAGRLPAVDRADEVLVGKVTAHRLGLHLGDQLVLDSISPSQLAQIEGGGASAGVRFDGPRPRVRIVGIGRTRLDIIGVGYAPVYLYATAAFYERHRDAIAFFGELTDVRLVGGAAAVKRYSAAAKARAGDAGEFFVGRPQDGLRAARDAAGVQGIALLLVGLAAALAGAALVGQAIGRYVAADADDRATLAALGLDRQGQIAITVAGFVPSAVAAAALSVGGAWFASRFFPTGLAGAIEVDPGAHLDGLVLLPGAALLAALVIGRAALGARWTVAPAATGVAARASVVDRAARSLPPPAAAGLRWAVAGRDGMARSSARAALAGIVVGVTGLTAAVAYRGSLDHLVSSPEEYGWTFDGVAGGGDDPEAVTRLRSTMMKDDAVGDLAQVHIVASVHVGGRQMQGYAFSPVRGNFSVTIVAGRPPAGPDELVLGTKSAGALHSGIGDTVKVRTGDGSPPFRVVGLGLFPTIETDRFSTGAMLSPDGLARAAKSTGYDQIVFRWRPGTDVPAATKRLRDALLLDSVAVAPPDVATLDLVRAYPVLLAAYLALLAALGLVHTLVVSARRRRRQLATLRAVGFTPGQVVQAVIVQGLVLATVGLAVGVPLGLVVGREAWRFHADRLGVGVVLSTPFAVLAVIGTLAVLIALGVGLVVGAGCTRSSPALALREE